MDKFEYRPSTFGADTVNMDGDNGFVGTADNIRSRVWAREIGKRDLLSAARLAREVEVDFACDYSVADRLRECADADVLNMTPGTFVAQGEWKQRGYILESNVKGVHFGWLNTSLVVALLDGAWWRLRGVSYLPEPPAPVGKQYATRTGEGVRVEGAAEAALHGLTIYGKCVQDGYPTCDNPVAIQGIEGESIRLLCGTNYADIDMRGFNMLPDVQFIQGTLSTINGTKASATNRIYTAIFPLYPNATYTVGVTNSNYEFSVRLYSAPMFNSSAFVYSDSAWNAADTQYTNASAKYMSVVLRKSNNANITPTNGAEAGLFADTIDAVNALYGIPDPYNSNGNKYRDTVDVDSSGNVTLTKRTMAVDLESITWPGSYTNTWSYPLNDYYNAVYESEAITGMRASEPDRCYPVCTTAASGSPFAGNYVSLNKIRQQTEDDGKIWLSTDTGYYAVGQGTPAYYYHLPAGTAIVPLKESAWYTVSLGTITLPTVEDNWLVTIDGDITPEIAVEYELAQHITLDYPHDFPYDYTKLFTVATVDTGRMVSCKPRIIFYGSVTDPEITIAGNKYKVTATVAAGARIEIDGRDHTVKMVASDGTVTDKFADALRGSGEGGGEYIFEPIPPGTHSITWDGTFGVDVQWYDEVGEPPWSLS